MKANKLLVFTFLFLLGGFFMKAQVENLKPLGGNSVLMNHKETTPKHNAQKSLSSASFLPFFDDFSYYGPFPNPNKWENCSQTVYVNRGYAIAPPTIGAATFDGLNRWGYPYNIAALSGSSISDTLLSMPIRLDYTDASLTVPITPADSIYLSFYYQVKGRGDMPESNDALSLFFYTVDKDTITHLDSINFTFPVWSKSGSGTPLQPNDTNFHRVLIPIYRSDDDTVFFKHGFRFAFANSSTKCGAIDHFHVDQIYLNRGRNANDTLFPDVSFVYEEKSLLKNYSQMPYTQFSGINDMKDSVGAVLRNNNNVKSGGHWSGQKNITTEYQIFDNTGNQVAITPPASLGANNVYNYDSIGYCNDKVLIHPPLPTGFKYNNGPFADTTSFQLKFYLKAPNDSIHGNDTAYFRQNFQNYYAYDDGTAEAGYYVSAFGGEMAVKYQLNYKEKLRAIDIFFDPILGVNVLQNTDIHLMVWGDNNNTNHKPYNTIANDSFLVDGVSKIYPVYYNKGYDVFTRFELSTPIELDSGQIFYVGTYQTVNQQLGIGFDLNNDTHQNIFYFDGTSWQNTSSAPMFRGSLMIHPVFGDSLMAIGVKQSANEKQSARIFPNPATNEISISSSDKISKVLITDILGNTLIEEQNPNQRISVSSLPNGMYLVRILNAKGENATQKLIISR